MDTRQLQQFLAVVDHATIGRAARHLNISQSAISQTVSKLENQLNCDLFTRTSKGMVVTPFGAALAARARVLTEEVRKAVEDIDALRDKGRVELALGVGPSQAALVVPEAVSRLLAGRPSLAVSLVEGNLSQLVPALNQGQIDLVVGISVKSPWMRGLIGETLYEDVVAVLAHPGHPLAHQKRPLQLNACQTYPWVLPRAPDALRERLESCFVASGVPLPPVRVETNSAIAIKSLLTRNHFLGYMPRSLVRIEEAADLLHTLDVPAAHWTRQVQVLYRHDRSLSPAAKALIRHLRAVARDIPQN